jgi:hypothetical protein
VANLDISQLTLSNSEEKPMRFIQTTTHEVDSLKKQVRRMQRAGHGEHAELLDLVARGAGYLHWQHVSWCLKQPTILKNDCRLTDHIERVVQAALRGDTDVVVTGPEATPSQPFILFSTKWGDAWLLDPLGNGAACLVWLGDRQASPIIPAVDEFSIRWAGRFDFSGSFFNAPMLPELGTRHIEGPAIKRVRRLVDRIQSAAACGQPVFSCFDAVPITESILESLVRSGWETTDVRAAMRNGGKYSPSRCSVYFP